MYSNCTKHLKMYVSVLPQSYIILSYRHSNIENHRHKTEAIFATSIVIAKKHMRIKHSVAFISRLITCLVDFKTDYTKQVLQHFYVYEGSGIGISLGAISSNVLRNSRHPHIGWAYGDFQLKNIHQLHVNFSVPRPPAQTKD